MYMLSMRVYHKLSCLSLRATWISTWIAEGRTRLIPKPGELSSVNERLTTRLRCLHLVSFIESGKRGAKEGCSRTFDNLIIDRIVTMDCHRANQNMSVEWVDVKKLMNLWMTNGPVILWKGTASLTGSVD